jgi:hypothetical protein
MMPHNKLPTSSYSLFCTSGGAWQMCQGFLHYTAWQQQQQVLPVQSSQPA